MSDEPVLPRPRVGERYAGEPATPETSIEFQQHLLRTSRELIARSERLLDETADLASKAPEDHPSSDKVITASTEHLSAGSPGAEG